MEDRRLRCALFSIFHLRSSILVFSCFVFFVNFVVAFVRSLMESNYEYLLVEADAPIAVVTLNRPERRNALSLGLMQELIACLRALGQSAEVRAVILAAAGPAFSAGHDLSE